MRKNSLQNQINKGNDKPLSPRLTLKFQSIRSRNEKISGGYKTNDINSSYLKYPSYYVTMETKSDIYEFRKDDGSVSSTHSSTSTSDCDLYDPKLDVVTSSSSQDIENNSFMKDNKKIPDETGNGEVANRNEKADNSDSGRLNGNRVSSDSNTKEYDCSSEMEKEESRRKRRKSNDNANINRHNHPSVGVQRYHRSQGNRVNHQSEGHSEQRSPKSKKRGSISSSETESNHSEGENEAQERTFSSDITSLSQNGNSVPHSPKVPPLKIVIPSGSGSLESETRERSKVSSSKQALPYVVNTAAESSESGCVESSTNNSVQPENSKESKSEVSSTKSKDESHPPEERFQRVTRSSHRIQAALAGTSTNNHASNDPNPHSQMVSSSAQKGELSGDSSTDEHNQQQAEVHPRKRKLRQRENASENTQQPSSSSSFSSTTTLTLEDPQQQSQLLNCYQMYLNIRKQVDKRRSTMFVVHPKPPQGFKDYLLNRCSYVLEGNAASRLNVPMIPPPQSLNGSIKELFIQQEKERYKLRLQHLIEREKLVLSAEQEILRVHGRAARAMANQTVPFSACSILKDEEIYNVLEFEQDDKDKTVRSRYNGRLFLSWLQDVDDKWEKIKEAMLLRHHNEAESLHAVQKLDWEWKLKELGLCDVKTIPAIDDIYVPIVHVSDDFDLLPA
ncbi:LOW QUALITY PROTEIN: ankyrin repeat domain-containing protein 12 [Centruroides vittatus]|uniref:LOW QUALITY PROTEIN: ankyrin repeat domain-containing protein 12 n=1 Tax=Centruroides vittatus TaxID=120091 RepID=UPI00350FD02D